MHAFSCRVGMVLDSRAAPSPQAVFILQLDVLPADLQSAESAYEERIPPGGKPKIGLHFFRYPASRSCPMGEVVAQIIEREIGDHFPLAPGGPDF